MPLARPPGAPHPGGRRRAQHRRAAVGRPAVRGLRRPVGGDRHRGLDLARTFRPQPGHARRDAARPRRQRGGPPPAPPGRPGADRLPDGARRRAGQGGGPGPGRRLRHQAVQHRGADGPGGRHPAPGRGGGSGRRVDPALCRSDHARRHARGVAPGPPHRPDRHRVQPLAPPPRERPPGHLQVRADRQRVGLRLQRGPNIVETYISYLRKKVDVVEPAAHPHHPTSGLHAPVAQRG